ncbi:membrane protein [Clostridiales bacterium PH28_bin88]|nr:membrane protein [Clostridiales bacterium PH28_bin88]
MATRTVIGVFASERVAEEAVNDLRRAGFDKDISILAKDAGRDGERRNDIGGATMAAEGAGNLSTGVATGGTLGGLAGLAVGAGALVIPGLGPLVAAGPIAGLLSGAATGGVAGGLVDWGIPEAEGRRYEEDVKQGKILVSVRADEKKADEAEKILRNHGAENVKKH